MIDWTKEDLHTYILIWCANADFIADKGEISLVLEKTSQDRYEMLREEFHGDNDYQRVEKIKAGFSSFEYSESEFDQVIKDMEDIFMSDGKYQSVERVLLLGLRRIFVDSQH